MVANKGCDKSGDNSRRSAEVKHSGYRLAWYPQDHKRRPWITEHHRDRSEKHYATQHDADRGKEQCTREKPQNTNSRQPHLRQKRCGSFLDDKGDNTAALRRYCVDCWLMVDVAQHCLALRNVRLEGFLDRGIDGRLLVAFQGLLPDRGGALRRVLGAVDLPAFVGAPVR